MFLVPYGAETKNKNNNTQYLVFNNSLNKTTNQESVYIFKKFKMSVTNIYKM